MKNLFAIILTAFTSIAFGQINIADSTAQVISYWSIGDTQTYSVSLQKIKVLEADTTSNELMTYDVDITVVDSTENSYLVEWFYRNYNTKLNNILV